MRAASHTLRLLGGLAAILLLACGGDDLLLPSAGQPAELRLVSGDLQEAQTGTVLPDPLVVEAVDGTGRPVVGSRILFRFVASTAGAEVSPDTAQTNGSGRAVAEVRLGEMPGAHPVEAVVADGPSGLRVRFVLTALSPFGGGGGGGGNGGGDGGGGDGGGGDGGGGNNGGNGGGNGGNDGGNGGNDGGSGGGDDGGDGGSGGGGNDGPGGGGGGGGDDDDRDDDDDDDDDRRSEQKGKDKGKGGKGKGKGG